MTKIQVKDLVNRFERYAPRNLAHEKDPIGLHFGSLDQTIEKVLVTLDVRPETVQEAIDQSCDFIFAHHPPIFQPVASFDLNIPQNQMYARLIKNDIAVYAAHTNLDAAENGMNDWLAAALDLENPEIMQVTQTIDGKDYGYGRVGNLREAVSFDSFLEEVKSTFAVEAVRYVGEDTGRNIGRVAVMGGSGGSYFSSALEKEADVFITGDLSYHVAHDIQASGMYAIDPGHHIESVCIQHLTALFKEWAKEENWDIEIRASDLNTDPFQFI
ncbi:MAG: Nif3-like dinuclear metal center hexameric protein [Atopococcus tabaci]|uniref:GTP cyclohydrolase 1 type 2 homolog n=1 Tax=Atopococcus tabaci TaxID=269774 RepID=A0AA43RKR3_9LACT|nr:Nif3-like dinuclear metal center hexameric protein [Atopococcus tabaci]